MWSFFRNLFKREEQQVDFLIIGLGNPGREYKNTRHNAGFLAVDHLSQKFDIPITRHQFKALYGQGRVGEHKIILAKPTTYMNLSAQSVVPMSKFYKVPLENLIILHDDVDLPLGTLRIRSEGGAGGQKGMASIIEASGSQEIARMRIGIGRPPGRMAVSDYVLENFTQPEQILLDRLFDRIHAAITLWMEQGIKAAISKYNGPMPDA